MESPKYEFIERGLIETKNLMNRMEFNMRNQLEKEIEEDVDNIKTKREKTPSHYKNEQELDGELQAFKKRIHGFDLCYKIEQNDDIFVKTTARTQQIAEKTRNWEMEKRKNDSLKKMPSFSERKYQLEIKILREELEKLRKTKNYLENELGSLKILSKPPTVQKNKKH